MAACQRVRRAVVRGLLPNLKATVIECVDCKVQRATVYDHRDYSKPLEVDPVCNRCNLKRGKGIVEGPHLIKCSYCGGEFTSKHKKGSCTEVYRLDKIGVKARNGGTMRIAKKLDIKKCALPECGIEFTPLVYWQICCSKDHAKRLRYLRRQHRIKEALEVAEASEGAEGVTGLSGGGIPNGNKR